MPVVLSPIVKVAGIAVDLQKLDDLVELRVETGLNRTGFATMRFLEYRLDDSTGPTWAIGTEVEVMDPEGTVSLFKGQVTAISVEADADLRQTTTYTAHDRSHRLARSTTAKTFVHMTVSDRITQVLHDHNIQANVESSNLRAEWSTQAASDLATVSELAASVGHDWWMHQGTFHSRKLSKTSPRTLTYGTELREFSVRITSDVPTTVAVNGWDPKHKQVITASADTAGVQEYDAAKAGADKFGNAHVLTAGIGRPFDQREASTISQAILDRVASASVTVKGTCDGFEPLGVGNWVKLENVGKHAAGEYPVTAVEHVLRRGRPLSTRFTAGDRSSRSLVDALSSTSSGRSAVRSHDGVVLGLVSNNNDPDHLGRVKVKLPTLGTHGQDFESGWARLVVAGGGKERGNFFHPEVNDEVLVAFEGGDLSQPVVLGGLHSTPETYLDVPIKDGAVQQRTIRSRTGHVMTFDDSGAAAEGILLQLKDGDHLLKLTPSKISVTSTSGEPIEIVSGQSKLVLDGKAGKISLDAPNGITLRSDAGPIELQGVSVKVTAQASLELSGAQAKIAAQAEAEVNGGGMLTIKGGMVQIN